MAIKNPNIGNRLSQEIESVVEKTSLRKKSDSKNDDKLIQKSYYLKESDLKKLKTIFNEEGLSLASGVRRVLLKYLKRKSKSE